MQSKDLVNRAKKAHSVIKKSYVAWSLLYIVETLIPLFTEPSPALAGLGDLSGLLPPEEIALLSQGLNEINLAFPILVILCGWPFVLWLPKNKAWIFTTFVSSCFLSLFVCAFSLFFPDRSVSIILGIFFPIAYACTLIIMLKYAFLLRDEVIKTLKS